MQVHGPTFFFFPKMITAKYIYIHLYHNNIRIKQVWNTCKYLMNTLYLNNIYQTAPLETHPNYRRCTLRSHSCVETPWRESTQAPKFNSLERMGSIKVLVLFALVARLSPGVRLLQVRRVGGAAWNRHCGVYAPKLTFTISYTLIK